MVVGEDYRLCRLLGEGGMGQVWEAIHTSTQEHFALKFLKGTKEEDRLRFLREVRAGAAVRHPNVIAVHDFIELADATLVIVMDLLDGETLGAVLKREQRIALAPLAALLLPVVSALEAAHALGIVHRDLKPDNVFLCKRAASGADVKVLDFGVAKLTASDGIAARTHALTGTGSMLGTPYYMSPEQVFADKDLDARADIWSLGVVMYECLAGVKPTEAETIGRVLKRIMVAEFDPLAKHCPDVPADVASLVGRMLLAERDNRPSLGEVRSVLDVHTAAGIPSFSGAARDLDVDPHAATVSGPGATPRPAREALHVPVPDAAATQADTNSAVSMLPARRSRATKRVVAGVAVALIAGTVAVRQWWLDEPKVPAGPVSSAAAPTGQPSTALAPSGVTPKAETAAPENADANANANANANATANGTAQAIGAADAGRPGTGVAAAPLGGRPTVVSKPSCEPGEVPSDGHCCPRGHVWQSGRCQRPLATTF